MWLDISYGKARLNKLVEELLKKLEQESKSEKSTEEKIAELQARIESLKADTDMDTQLRDIRLQVAQKELDELRNKID